MHGAHRTRNPNFEFVHFDVRDQLHNNEGTKLTSDIVVPLASGTVDRIVLQSVFTHMFPPDIKHYLREFKRVLKPHGLVYATVSSTTTPSSTLPERPI